MASTLRSPRLQIACPATVAVTHASDCPRVRTLNLNLRWASHVPRHSWQRVHRSMCVDGLALVLLASQVGPRRRRRKAYQNSGPGLPSVDDTRARSERLHMYASCPALPSPCWTTSTIALVWSLLRSRTRHESRCICKPSPIVLETRRPSSCKTSSRARSKRLVFVRCAGHSLSDLQLFVSILGSRFSKQCLSLPCALEYRSLLVRVSQRRVKSVGRTMLCEPRLSKSGSGTLTRYLASCPTKSTLIPS